MDLRAIAEERHCVLEGRAAAPERGVGLVVDAEHRGGEGDRAARVLLLAPAPQVGRVGELGLHLLLAVAEVVVGDDRDDHAAGVAGGDLERAAAVVEVALPAPAHPVPALPPGRLALVGQPEVPRAEPHEVGREDHAAGVAAPAGDVERGVVLGEERVARVAEDGLDEVEVRHQAAGGEEAHLHRARGRAVGGRADDRPQEERGPHPGRIGARPGEGEGEHAARRVERGVEERGERAARHLELVGGDGQPAVGDVEDALRGAPVGGRVVEHALLQPEALEVGRGVVVVPGRQGEHAGEPRPVEREGPARQARHAAGQAAEVGVQEGLDPAIDGRERPAEEPILLELAAQERARQLEQRAPGGRRAGRLADRRELELRVADEVAGSGRGGGEAGLFEHAVSITRGRGPSARTRGRAPRARLHGSTGFAGNRSGHASARRCDCG
ncbi:MAG: hypothetical protein QM704_17410 [Anaeromyxobacteraceae bacterium]